MSDRSPAGARRHPVTTAPARNEGHGMAPVARALLDLQRTAGNKAVTTLATRRVPVQRANAVVSKSGMVGDIPGPQVNDAADVRLAIERLMHLNSITMPGYDAIAEVLRQHDARRSPRCPKPSRPRPGRSRSMSRRWRRWSPRSYATQRAASTQAWRSGSSASRSAHRSAPGWTMSRPMSRCWLARCSSRDSRPM
ncbi:hypothetical protein [Fodinicola feengrottensis]|uniref:hypothetical protein n=1 Tax=Fodinicola feengrottensis TaxID=435914 RepID=UPI00244287AF|nr:hypothetical protein [Fodinicola feengrottensis]